MTAFFVPGTPQPQGNKSAFVRNGKAVLVEGRRPESRDAFKAWRNQVTTTAAQHFEVPLVGPVRVVAVFWMPKPASTPKKVRWAAKRPDIDKLLRSLLDSLTGVAFVDDGQVVQVNCLKRYAFDDDGSPTTSGAEIDVEVMA